MFKRLYEWTLSLAARPSAPYALGAVSFAESSFFPIPPDVMLVPMALARPDRVWNYALITTATSVMGGLVGYAIGALLYESVGQWLFRLYGLSDGAEAFRASYAEYGHWVILLKGLTPIPYKLVTITSGFAAYDLFWFTVLSLITRGARFFLLAALLGRYGAPIKRVLDRHTNTAAIGLIAIIVVGFFGFRYLFR
jgi:membrane protein YqaA with SNARE-associated domain